MKLNDQNGINALVSFLVNKHGATTSPIDHGMQYQTNSGVYCNIYNTGTILIQNGKNNPALEEQIAELVAAWSA
ncbi:hypothetical protein WCT84_06535 [Pectobacterium brasiliense]|uniref:hypothetical protein n=1 Tax=Pectobacterium TaxID=122277 RepID=UPI001F16F0D4|nr:hypothetical protein [Pectobacterium versatile]